MRGEPFLHRHTPLQRLLIARVLTGIEKAITISGAIVTFVTNLVAPLKRLVAAITPVQDLNGQENPYPPGGGKNLLDDVNGLIRGGYSDVGALIKSDLIHYISYNMTLPAGTYTFSTDLANCYLTRVLIDNEVIAGRLTTNTYTFTISAESDFKISMRDTDTSDISSVTPHSMIESGSQATSYAPYSNICPISGWTGAEVARTGKNLFGGNLLRDSILSAISTATDDSTNRTVTFPANTTPQNIILTNVCGLSEKFKPNTSYTFIMTYNKAAASSKGSNLRVRYTDDTTAIIPSITSGDTKETVVLVTSNSKTVKHLEKYNSGGTTYLYYDESGVFEGTLTAQDFIAYTGQQDSITFPNPPGTVYGGTLKVNKDGTGVLTVTHAEYIFTNNNTYTAYQASTGNWYITAPTIGFKFNGSGYCNEYVQGISATYSNRFRLVNNTVYVYDNRFTTSEAVAQILATQPIQVVGELAEPIVYNLTDLEVIETLKGVNNVWADTGDVAVTYYNRQQN